MQDQARLCGSHRPLAKGQLLLQLYLATYLVCQSHVLMDAYNDNTLKISSLVMQYHLCLHLCESRSLNFNRFLSYMLCCQIKMMPIVFFKQIANIWLANNIHLYGIIKFIGQGLKGYTEDKCLYQVLSQTHRETQHATKCNLLLQKQIDINMQMSGGWVTVLLKFQYPPLLLNSQVVLLARLLTHTYRLIRLQSQLCAQLAICCCEIYVVCFIQATSSEIVSTKKLS